MNPPFPFDLAVLIGRFQPFHRGHAALLAQALASAPRVAIILGSSLGSRSARNPLSWRERAAMISATLDPGDRSKVHFIPVRDYYHSARWAGAVEDAVRTVASRGERIALVGHRKDASSYYLGLFPGWTFVEAGAQGDFNSTELRGLCYEGGAAGVARALESLPAALQGPFADWLGSPEFARMREEHLAIQESRKAWGLGPFITLDSVVQACGCVLLVRRGRCPGQGLWALPGGFLELEERLLDGALRELKEETGLDLKQRPMGAEPRATAVFDHPGRSQRGRTVTHAYSFQLDDASLPAVAGADDAADAAWIPVSRLQAMEDQFHEDHFHILDHFLSLGLS